MEIKTEELANIITNQLVVFLDDLTFRTLATNFINQEKTIKVDGDTDLLLDLITEKLEKYYGRKYVEVSGGRSIGIKFSAKTEFIKKDNS